VTLLDWLVLVAYLAVLVGIGFAQRRKASGSEEDFFVSGRRLPWYVAGTSMIAASFASDTPLLVSGLVREHGIWRNWMWWGGAVSLLLTVFFFSRLWRRSRVLTEVELTELRYSGAGAAGLRGFKAVYWGLLYNCFVAGAWSVTGLSKVVQSVLGWEPAAAIVVCSLIACVYSVLSGFWGVVATDCFQFALAIVGSMACAYFAVQAAGGWEAAVAAVPPGKLDLVPADPAMFSWFLSFVLVQWWAWKNTDGGGLLVQRMASCRDERHAVWATLWYSVFHFAVRGWPWVVVALASLTVVPDAELPPKPGDPSARDHEMAYAVMIQKVIPAGLKGLLVGWFLAEFMSSINTHTNWGSSFLVNDFYKRFVKRDGTPAHYVAAGRAATVVVMLGAVGCAFLTGDIAKSFDYVLTGTAAVGVVAAARWLWWRVNVWSEVTVMVLSPLTSFVIYPQAIRPHALPLLGVSHNRMVELTAIVVASCLPALAATLLTPAERPETLEAFYRRVRPPGPGWRAVAARCPGVASDLGIPRLLGLWLAGVAAVYGLMYGVYAMLFGRPGGLAVGAASGLMLGLIVWWTREMKSPEGQ
jgi:Na+/proline symporter